jgi:hypothetical protein
MRRMVLQSVSATADRGFKKRNSGVPMTTIKTTCSQCGDVELTPDDLALELEPSEETGVYRFTCPTCSQIERRPANARVVSVLLATGVAYEVVRPDPITEGEIDQFVTALNSEIDPFRLLAN